MIIDKRNINNFIYSSGAHDDNAYKMDILASRGQMKALPYIRESLCDNLGVGGGRQDV